MRYYLLGLAAAGVCVLLGYNVAQRQVGANDVTNNEMVCQAGVPKGFAAYTITRWGELRGCLYVDRAEPSRVRVAKRMGM